MTWTGAAVRSDAERAPAAAWYALGVLTLANFLALVDRQVLLLLAEPIRRELALTDFQLGLLQGVGIALFTALASYPLGWLADRFDRRWVLATCVAAWSLAVIGCGLAGSFGQLLTASALVGAGEAGIAPVVYALVPLLFAGRQRQLANSLFAVTAIGGGALAMAVCGQLVGLVEALRPELPAALRDTSSWRLSFFLAALPAPIVMLLILSIRLPRRTEAARTAASEASSGERVATPAAGTAFGAFLHAHRGTFASFYAGSALGGFAFGAVIVWLAVIAARYYGEGPAAIGASLGAAQLFSAVSGFAGSVLLVRALQSRVGHRLPLRGMWIATLCSLPACLALPFATQATHLYVLYATYGFFLTLGTMLYPTVLQTLTPDCARGRAVSVQFILTMIGAATAPAAVGFVSDALAGRPNALILAVVLVAAPAILASASLLLWCERYRFDATASAAAALDARGARATEA